MIDLHQQVLRTDISGMPLEWIGYQDAVRLYHSGHVTYDLGTRLYRIRGGINASTGCRSSIVVNTIIATEGNRHVLEKARNRYTPPLNNPALFKRDAYICLYCSKKHASHTLSRDHVRPLMHGGADVWNNVVTACKRCNNHKAGRTPEQAHMQLLAVPFTPTHAEYVYLQGRRVLADQMEFLLKHFPRKSLIHERLQLCND